MEKRYWTLLTAIAAVMLAAMIIPSVMAATAVIYDNPSVDIVMPRDDCDEVIIADSTGGRGGNYDIPLGGGDGIWLRKTGWIMDTSAIECSAVIIQYRSSDFNDGVTDIYVDDMNDPIIRIDTFKRGHWYVAIYDLPYSTHVVKVHAPSSGLFGDVVRSPHRTQPAFGDNWVWYLCFCDPVEYEAAIDGYCETDGVGVSVSIDMDASPTGETTPYTFWGLNGVHTFTVPGVDPHGHEFRQWETGEISPTIIVSSAGTYTAYYAARYNLTITTTSGGTTVPIPGIHTYWNEPLVSVSADPGAGWDFDHWLLDELEDYSNPIYVMMDSDHTLHAVFDYSTTIAAYCYTESAPVGVDVLMDGSPAGTTPQTYTDLAGTHTFTVLDTDPHGHPFTRWNTGETSTTISINGAGTYTAYYGRASVPALTEWGMLILLLLLMLAGISVIRRRRRATA